MSANYQSFQQDGENSAEDNFQEDPMLLHILPQSDRTQWNRIEDLDSFFTSIYQYHQKNGFLCIMVKKVLDLFTFIFLVSFSILMFFGVKYSILFKDKKPPSNADKVWIDDCVYTWNETWERIPAWGIILLIVAVCFWIIKFFLTVKSSFVFYDIKKFYNEALGIADNELENFTWNDVSSRLMEVQIEQRICIENLTELDIYHRILRFKNYFIAMINKNVIPVQISLPIFGDLVFLTRGLKYNIEMILFTVIGAPFENNWQLKNEFKRYENRQRLADELSKRIFYFSIANFLLFPFIFIFQILWSFFHYTDLIKKDPGLLGLRIWSHYAEAKLRHYNELEHELRARLNRAYRPSTKYLESFTSPLGAVIARAVVFAFGSLLAVLGLLSVYDVDVLQVEPLVAIATFLVIASACFRALIPNENLVWCPEVLMTKILSEVCYLPDYWKGKAHTQLVRKEFSQFFQYKFSHLVESLLSPLITPTILYFSLRYRALEIVDFLRNFTVEVVGVGDICSFAQMDLHKHGSRNWHPNFRLDYSSEMHEAEEIPFTHTDNGKTELSLLHFTLTNPNWTPPPNSSAFLNSIRAQAKRDFNALPVLQEENPLRNSINASSVDRESIGNFNCMQSRWMGNIAMNSENICGQLNKLEGSRNINTSGILASITQSQDNAAESTLHDIISGSNLQRPQNPAFQNILNPSIPQDFLAIDMSVSTLYLHELHHRYKTNLNVPSTRVNANQPRSARISMHPPIHSYYHSTDSPLIDISSGPSIPRTQSSKKNERTPLIK